jgi:phosphate transport system substrate-binding protein
MSLSQKLNRRAFSASAIALALGLAACGPSAPPTDAPGATGGTSPAATSGGGAGVRISGAGATAPNPLYQRWFSEFGQKTGTQISYQSVGSGAGITQFMNQTVDFGASDAPLKDEERAKYPPNRGSGPIQIPSTGLFIVFAYNVPGVDNLKLSREAYCGIVDGSIKTWNDPVIAKDNAGVNLPSAPIAFVHRSDGSGTTDIFTKHIEKACPNWKVGSGKSVEWPTGTGAKGNEGVTAQIQQTQNSIGYTEFSYAKETGQKIATIQNKAGEFVTPTPEAAAKALEGVEAKDLVIKVPDPAGKDAYPIVSVTYLLLYEQYPEQAKADAMKNLVEWALKDGQQAATDLGYIPLPSDLATKVSSQLGNIKVAAK